VIFYDPAVTITTNLVLIFVCVAHHLKINIMQLDFIKCSFKQLKKIKNTSGVHIFFFIKVCTFLHTISYKMFM